MELVCQHCAAINRVPDDKPVQRACCGKCKQALFQARPFSLDLVSFDKHLQNSALALLVDFWAPWCGPCKTMAPQYEMVAEKLEPRCRLAKVNTEQESVLASRYQIRSIPTLMVFKDGREMARQAGAMTGEQISAWIGQIL